MDPRLLKYYNQELQHLREMGGEFAKEYPKIAGRLSLDGFECADPYVERLLEGVGFLAARVQLKIDAEFPRFTQHLLESVYPNYLAPTPSMTVVQFTPDPTEGSLAAGPAVERDTPLRSVLGKGEQTACEYRTAHRVELWPIELTEVEYFRYAGAVASLDVPNLPGVKAGIRFRLKTTGGVPFSRMSLEKLPIYLRGSDDTPMRLYEQLLANAVATVVRPTKVPAPWREVVSRDHIRRVGFEDDEALLPVHPRAFSGYRLLQEYFSFPSRFMFVELGGLGPAVRRCEDQELDLIVLFDRSDPSLEGTLDLEEFALFCTPAVNLFPKRGDRIHLADREHEYHVVPDRTRPVDYEVFSVEDVVGFGTSAEQKQEFKPFYGLHDSTRSEDHRAYFALRRLPRMLSEKHRRSGSRSGYVGSETFISLVDADEAPYQSDLRQLAVNVLCTNRDLPLQMPLGTGRTDFTMASGAPVKTLRCVAGPTKPRPSFSEGDTSWRLISHLSLNYLSLADSDERQGAASLREMLALYGDLAEAAVQKQIEGVRSITSEAITRRLPGRGPVGYGRGLEVTLTFDEAAFEGTGVFLLGAVLENFFAKYVSINSFAETVIRTLDRGEIMRWPARIGGRVLL